MKRKTNEEFINELNDRNPDIEVIGEYVNSNTKIHVKGRYCGHQWESRPGDLLKGHGCPICKGINSAKRNKKTTQQFVEEIKAKNPSIMILGEYQNNKSPIRVKCNTCGHIWAPRAESILNGSGCPRCAGNIKLTDHQFRDRLKTINSDIEVLDDYLRNNEKVRVRCRKCGHIWSSRPYSLLNGSGCPECAGLRKKETEEFIHEIKRINPTVRVLGEYRNNRTKILVQCDNCGYQWKASPRTLLRGQGCPECIKTGTSFVEQFILIAFRRVLGQENVISRDRKTIGLELDIYIPEKKIAIEPGSWFWHKDVMPKDTEKRIRCEKEGIRLITIYDSFPADKEAPFDIDCFTYENSLNEAGHIELKKLLIVLFRIASVHFVPTDTFFTEIINAAHIEMHQMNHEEFVDKISSITPSITIRGRYNNLKEKILVSCNVCGYEWKTTPISLLKGSGCSACAGVKKLTAEEFKARLNKVNQNIEVLGDYINVSTKLLVKSTSCGHEWMGTPATLLKGAGCPLCAGNRKKTQEQFEAELKKVNPNVTVIGEYVNAVTKIRIRCNFCGQIFECKPNQLLSQRTGCKFCNTKKAIQKRTGKTHLKTTREFKEELKIKNPDIEVVGEYSKSTDLIEVKCKVCGYVWETRAGRLLQGAGCPICRKKQRAIKHSRSPEEFTKALKEKAPTIVPLEQYVSATERIRVRCIMCGHEWSPKASSLLSGKGCPHCSAIEGAKKRSGKLKTKTTEQFKKELYQINPSIRINGEYKNNKTKIHAECKKCGYQWDVRPESLLNGHACPVCARNR